MSEDQPSPAGTTVTAEPRRKRTAVIVAVAAGLVVVAAAVAIPLIVNANAGPDFEAAVESDCGLNLGVDARLLDDGKTLILNGAGEKSTGLSVQSLGCIFAALDVPASTLSRMDSTRAMDGRQRDQLAGYSVEWTYHPDDGLDVLFAR